MTLEQQQSLERELKGAMEWPDEATRPMRVQAAMANCLLALIDCQRKTSDRVKKLSWKFTTAMVALGAGGGTVATHWDVVSKIIFGN